MSPIELLRKKLEEYIKAKTKSIESYIKEEIDGPTHQVHLKTLNPLIKLYTESIELLDNELFNTPLLDAIKAETLKTKQDEQ